MGLISRVSSRTYRDSHFFKIQLESSFLIMLQYIPAIASALVESVSQFAIVLSFISLSVAVTAAVVAPEQALVYIKTSKLKILTKSKNVIQKSKTTKTFTLAKDLLENGKQRWRVIKAKRTKN